MNKAFSMTVVALLTACAVYAGSETGLRDVDSTLGKSKIKVLAPEKWNKKVLIFAHGYRPKEQPLSAEISRDGGMEKPLLDAGWIVAITSYRRNGFMIDDAVLDLDSLRMFIEKRYGKPEHVYLRGTSMGADIVVPIAERMKGRYAGVVANGGAIRHDRHPEIMQLTHKPVMPILFLCTRSETEGSEAYMATAKGTFKPVLWRVERDGHCNTSDGEDLAAIFALADHVEHGKKLESRDGTIVPEGLISAALPAAGGLKTVISSMSATYGNFMTEFIADDFKHLGISVGSDFILTYKDKNVPVRFGTTYGDVPRGGWIAFLTAEGYLRIARNYANAAAVLGCAGGDTLLIRKMDLILSDSLVSLPVLMPQSLVFETLEVPVRLRNADTARSITLNLAFADMEGVTPEPVEWDVNLVPGSDTTVMVLFTAETPVPLSGMDPVALVWTVGYRTADGSDIAFTGNDTLKIVKPHPVPVRTRPVVVDGKLDEWDGLTYLVPDPARPERVTPLLSWGNLEDSHCRFSTACDDSFFYIAVNGVDDTLYRDSTKKLWNQDGTNIVINAADAPERIACKKPTDFWFMAQRGSAPGAPVNADGSKLPDGVRYAGITTDKGYTLEIAVPHRWLDEVQGKRWTGLRLNICMFDYDTVDERELNNQLWWQSSWKWGAFEPGTGMFIRP